MLPPAMLQMMQDRFGWTDHPDAWEAVARAAEQHSDDDGTIRLPSTALCMQAMT